MITPAISVLSAVEGLEVVVARRWSRSSSRSRSRSSPCCSRSSASAPAPSAALFGPVMARVVRRARARRRCARSSSTRASCARSRPPTAVEFLVRPPRHRVHRARRRSCWRSPAPRRCTPTWATSAARRSAARGSSLVFPALIAQLPGPGRADPRHAAAPSPTRSSCSSRLGADPDGRAGHGGDGDRLAGGDLRRLLGHPPGGAARLPAAADHPPHLARGDRPGLRAGGQLGLFVAVVALVVGFGSSDRPGRRPTASPSPARWPSTRSCSSSSCACCGTSRCGSCSPARRLFLTVDLTFFAANLTKVLHGGWFPLSIAARRSSWC